jgi:hypothetical protein
MENSFPNTVLLLRYNMPVGLVLSRLCLNDPSGWPFSYGYDLLSIRITCLIDPVPNILPISIDPLSQLSRSP